MAKIIITSDHENGSTRGAVNGAAFSVPHNKTVEVSDAQLEVIQNASAPRTTVKVLLDEEPAEAEVKPIVAFAGAESEDPATPGDISPGTGGEHEDSSKESFDTAAFLDRSIDAQREDFDTLTAGQVDALIAAENDRKDGEGKPLPPRATLIAALEGKKAAFAAAQAGE